MQKLVTIYLENMAYARGKMIVASLEDKHGLVEEHLQQYLTAGWNITSLQSFGGVEGLVVRGWVVVVLEKQE